MAFKPNQEISIIDGPTPSAYVPLSRPTIVFGRPDEENAWNPDVDLSPDYKVSRRHARLVFRENAWWIEDLGSMHGTFVAGVELVEPVPLEPGTAVQMGTTVWVLNHPHQKRRTWGDLSLDFSMVPAVNYALYHCGIPILSGLSIRNAGRHTVEKLILTAALKGYSDPWRQEIHALSPDEKVAFEEVRLPLHYEKLEGNEERKRARLEIRLNGDLVTEEEVHILGFYQWPTDRSFRRSLACFVQPSHPLAGSIMLDANTCIPEAAGHSSITALLKSDRPDRIELVVRALYDCIAGRYRIQYLPPPASLEDDYQVVRPPHRVLFDAGRRKGGGTCVDLALLFASCLENVRLQPLILIVREQGSFHHAFTGCWNVITERFEPIISDGERVRNLTAAGPGRKLIVFETTGVTDRFAGTCSFDDAVRLAEEELEAKEFLYALDISAVRQTVAPLQFPLSPGATEVLRRAEETARIEGSEKLETRHLLASLACFRAGVEDLLVQAGVDLREAEAMASSTTMTEASSGGGVPHPTLNYRRALEDARLTAGDAGLSYVDTTHLWYAVLLSRSESVDRLLERLGTTRKHLKSLFDRHFTWTADIVKTLPGF